MPWRQTFPLGVMEFKNLLAKERGLPLFQFRTGAKADVAVYCLACFGARIFPLEAVIDRLTRRGLPGEEIGIIELADYLNQRCPKCDASRFETRPAFEKAYGSGI